MSCKLRVLRVYRALLPVVVAILTEGGKPIACCCIIKKNNTTKLLFETTRKMPQLFYRDIPIAPPCRV